MAKAAHSYIFFDSNCREAMEFYAKLGIGTIESMISNADAPNGMDPDPSRKDNIMHAALKVGDTLVMASDSPPNSYKKPQGFSIHYTAGAPDEADSLFAELAKGGSIELPLEETFWAQRFGACVDRFGIPWMVSVDKPMG